MSEPIVAIIGAGPAALTLGYILQGHIPYYDSESYGPHPDKILHASLLALNGDIMKASRDKAILDQISRNYEAFFVTDVLPVNLLLDVLTIPSETCLANEESMQPRVKWISEPERAVSFVLYDKEPPGGQWGDSRCDDPEARVLSYAEMLSLPGYSFSQYYLDHIKTAPPLFCRPKRQLVTEYYVQYAQKMGMAPEVGHVTVSADPKGGYTVSSATVQRHHQYVVLASGVASASENCTFDRILDAQKQQVLVIGTGVSSADAVGWARRNQRPVAHIYKRKDSSGFPTPLRRFPKQLYPEYNKVFSWMQAEHDDEGMYTGYPNGELVVESDGKIGIKTVVDGNTILSPLPDCGLICVRTGREGSLEYASDVLNDLIPLEQLGHLKKSLLREAPKISLPFLKRGLWAVGSLTGDSLVRYLKGVVVSCAGDIFDDLNAANSAGS